MLESKRLPFVMLLLLVVDQGFLVASASSSANITNSTDVEQLHPPMVQEDEEISEEIFEESEIDSGNSSNSLQRENLRGYGNCGIINRGNGIVINGEVVRPPNKYPWMVQLLAGGMMCGGSIISENYILTAAHCVKRYPPGAIQVLFLTNTHSLRRGPQVQRIIMHPRYDHRTLTNDIALLRLKRNIICDRFRNPVCLPPPNMEIPVGTVCTTIGWGLTKPGPRAPTQELREGQMKRVKCARGLSNTQYCFLGFRGKMQNACFGDSGGPTVLERNGKYYQFGITSTGDDYCQIGISSTHTAVPKYIQWINRVMKSGRFSEELEDNLHCEQQKNEENKSGDGKQQENEEVKSGDGKQEENEETKSGEDEKKQM